MSKGRPAPAPERVEHVLSQIHVRGDVAKVAKKNKISIATIYKWLNARKRVPIESPETAQAAVPA